MRVGEANTAHSPWDLPQGVDVLLVDSEERLEQVSELLEGATCCGIDAEWPPEETTAEARSGGPPHASLVQLAIWGASHCTVLLLDMLALPQPAVKRALQQLFRNRACLKLGFGLVHDLRAIAAALGGEGGACIAVVEPACDLGSVHRFLRHRRVDGVHKAVDLGLSGLVEAQLGRPLDKALQCSAWGQRPLSAEQLRYAAADAACLLGLLGSLIAAVGQPEEGPMSEAAEEAAAGAGTSAAAEQEGTELLASAGAAARLGGNGELASAEAAGEEGVEEAADSASSSGSSASRACSPAGEAAPEQQQQPPPATALLGGCSQQQLQAAAAAWGVRLEISGARAVKRGSRRGGRRGARQRQLQRVAAGSSCLEPQLSEFFPRHIPWMDRQRQLTGAPRFLCDVMAEGLARQLRLCGFDTESLQASMEKAPRHAVWRAMVERSEAEERVVLTKDRTFVAANHSDQAFLVQACTKQQQLEEVLEAFGLTVQEDELLSRCARCNGEFIPEPMPAALLPPGHDVPPGILAQHDEFWVCARCSGVYWQGSQYGRAKARMTDLISRMDKVALA